MSRMLCLLLVLWTVGCGSTPPATEAPSLPLHHPWRLYPLLANSAWSYDVDTGDGDPVLAVTRVVNVAGHRVDVSAGDEAIVHYELRDDGIFRPATNSYLIRQPVEVGATWPTGGDRVATVRAIDVGIETPSGVYRDCVAIEEVGAESGIHVRTVYCPDVGPVEVQSHVQLSGQEARVIARLRGAMVGGR